MHVTDVRADLLAEQQALDDLVGDITEEQWALPTPSPRWSVADQIAHLTYFDWTATVAITDPDRFQTMVAELMNSALADDELAGDDLTLGVYRELSPAELLERWRTNRAALADASATLADDTRIVWYGPSMGSKSFLTARLMECWAHGQDVADALGVERQATDRLRHIAQLGFITRGWSYVNRGLEPATEPVRVELTAPSCDVWAFGPDDAAESVTGSAVDFCLVVTQRRHVDDTGLVVAGDAATEWMEKAQAYAGPPSDGPDAGARG
ncbi:MAG: TIGR03084 family metal-binding protein [Ilumatobacteraceae bacterium]